MFQFKKTPIKWSPQSRRDEMFVALILSFKRFGEIQE